MKRKQKFLSIILAALLTVASLYVPLPVFAEVTSGTCGDNAEWSFDDTTGVLTISGTGSTKKYSTSVMAPWNSLAVTDIVVEDGITGIGEYTFYKSPATNITLADSVTTLGAFTFDDSRSLKTVTLPANITSLPQACFFNCTVLESVNIPTTITSIGMSAFSGCWKLTPFTLHEGIIEIGQGAFYKCKMFTTINIPSTVGTIGDGAFSGCTALTAIDVDSANTVYKSLDGVLYNYDMTNLIQYPAGKSNASFTVPDTVIKINDNACMDCASLSEVTFNDQLKTIGQYAFSSTGVTDVTIPDNVTAVLSDAFYNCNQLKNVNIGSGVKNVLFISNSGNSRLESITVSADNAYLSSENGVLFNKDKTNLIMYPRNKSDLTCYTVPDTVATIKDYAFYYTNLNTLIIPESVTKIEYNSTYSALYSEDLTNLIFLNSSVDLSSLKLPGYPSNPYVIYGLAGSTAESFASTKGYTFLKVCTEGDENHILDESTRHTVAPECEEQGYTAVKCYVCLNEIKSDLTPATDHSYTNYVSNDDATCTADGTKTAVCDNGCGKTDTVADTGSMKPHTYTLKTVEPTCTADGYDEYTCTECGDTYKANYTDATEHSAEWVTVKEPSYDADGEEQYICTVCKEVLDTRLIDKLVSDEPTTEPLTEVTTKPLAEVTTKPAESTTKAEYIKKTDYDMFRIVSGYGCIKIAWQFDTRLTGYDVMISTTQDGKYKLLASVENSKKSYYVANTLNSHTKYYIKLVGYTTVDNVKYYTAESEPYAVKTK